MTLSLPDAPTMSVAEVARVLGVSRDAAYDAVKRGEIPALHIGRAIRIPTAKVAEMLGVESAPVG